MPRIEQWLPFFEQSSEKRDTASWEEAIKENVAPYPVKVQQLVSDRATPLVQLGKPDYFDVNSMPDLFHFKQILAKKAGTVIGRAWQKSLKLYKEIKSTGAYYSKRKPYEDRYLWHDNSHRKYQNGMDLINKAIHGFDINGQWKNPYEIRRQIVKGIVMVEEALISCKGLTNTLKIQKEKTGLKKLETIDLHEVVKDKQRDGLDVEVIEKLFKQIPDILEGIIQWQKWTKKRLTSFVDKCFEQDSGESIFPQLEAIKVKSYLLYNLLPLIYFQIILARTSSKNRNKNLQNYYKKIIQQLEEKLKEHPLTEFLTAEQKQICCDWCEQIVRTFQRSSSQVEGRNGYLAFVHKANRGIPEQRLQVLTTVHNFDIRGLDGKTPAERLFGKPFDLHFPDLFDFVLQSVTSFPEPRHHKPKPLQTLTVRA